MGQRTQPGQSPRMDYGHHLTQLQISPLISCVTLGSVTEPLCASGTHV